jgi:hypothetical protein
MTKALILWAYPLGYECAGYLIQHLADPTLGRATADGFKVLLNDEEDVLNRRTFAVIKVTLHCLKS